MTFYFSTFISFLLLFVASQKAYSQGTVSGKIYIDYDASFSYDLSDQGTSALVELYTSANVLIFATSSDINGDYSFPGITYGDYYVKINTPPSSGFIGNVGDNAGYTPVGVAYVLTPVFTLDGSNSSATYNCAFAPLLIMPDYPVFQASNLTVSGIAARQFTISWTRGDGQGILILVKSSSSISTHPDDYTSYFGSTTFGAGSNINGAYAVYTGSGTSVTVTNLNPETTYYIAAYEYNNPSITDFAYKIPPATTNATTSVLTYANAGHALQFNGTDQYVDQVGSCIGSTNKFEFIQNSGVFTLEAWIKLSDPNADALYTILANTNDPTEKGMCFGFDNRSVLGRNKQLFLGLYNGSGTPQIQSASPANIITDTEWHHVAVSSNGTTVKFYVDGWEFSGTGTQGVKSTGQTTRQSHIGACPFGSTGVCINYTANQHFFYGLIDELKLWYTSRTLSQIRSNLHLTLLGGEAGLYSYWQFENPGNNTLSEPINLKTGINGGTASTPASWVISEAPVARGVSISQTVSSSGTHFFSAAGLRMTFPSGTYPNGDIFVFKLQATPVTIPGTSLTGSSWWIINNYGTNQTFSAITDLTISGIGTISSADASDPSNLILFKRPSNASGNTWVSKGGAVSAGQGTATVTYNASNNITSFSQIVIGSGAPLPVNFISFDALTDNNNNILLNWKTSDEADNNGFYIEIKRETDSVFINKGFVSGLNYKSAHDYSFTIQNIASGLYYCRLKQVDMDGRVTYSGVKSISIGSYIRLENPYPNPFTRLIHINIEASDESYLSLKVYDIIGNLIGEIFEGQLQSGKNQFVFQPADLSNSAYIIKASGYQINKSWILHRTY